MHVTDPAVLRALSHPLRQRIMGEFDVLGHARAADLAEALGEPANSVSFHLRALAKAGIIEEAPELARDRRDRVWKQTFDSFTIDEDIPGVEQYLKPYIDWLQQMIFRASRSGDKDSSASVQQARLTVTEMRELADEVYAVITRRVNASVEAIRQDPHNPERRYHRVMFAIGPWDPEAESAGDGAAEGEGAGTTGAKRRRR